MKLKTTAAALGLLAITAGAQASTTIFSDDFNSDVQALNSVPTGWTVTNGTVDVVGPGGFGLCAAGQGNCVDLDGSTSQSGLLAKSLTLTAGVTYTATFDLIGNQRANQIDTVTVGFGTTSSAHNISELAPSTAFSTTFTPTTSGTYTLSFLDNSNNNIGAILDNVKVSAVPEPETYGMLLAGLGLMGFLVRRKKHGA